MQNLVPIGRFSQLTRLTVKALRYYDETGLLRPAAVDPDSGYRYYSLAQCIDAERIRALRMLQVPLEEIREILSEQDPARRIHLLDRHRSRLEESIAGHQRVLTALTQMLLEEGRLMEYEVRTKHVVTQPIASIRTRTSVAALPGVMGQAWGEIYGYLGELGVRPAGASFTIYHDPEFKEEDIDVEIGVPVEEAIPPRGRIAAGELPAGAIAYTLHLGAYAGIGGAYRALASWIQSHGHEFAGAPREVYLTDPAQTREADYRTEIEWPIAA